MLSISIEWVLSGLFFLGIELRKQKLTNSNTMIFIPTHNRLPLCNQFNKIELNEGVTELKAYKLLYIGSVI